MPTEWFVLPVVSEIEPLGDQVRRPAYMDIEGISRFVGADMHFDSTYSEPWAGSDRFVGQLTGTSTALESVASKDDAYGQSSTGMTDGDIATYLNDAHSKKWTHPTWMDAYGVSE